MGTRVPYGITVTGQRPSGTSYSSNMLSGFTNRKDSIGDSGGLMAWDGIGRDPSLKTPEELAEEARERAKEGDNPYFNNFNGPTLEELYARINTAYGGDTAGQVVTSAMESDYLNALGETYSEQLAREALERSKQYENEMLARNNAATQAAEAAQTTEPTTKQIDTQDKDDEFQVKVNAAGGVNPGTLGEVIKVAEEVYGEGSSRAIVSVLAESIKAGITGKDLSEATGLSEEEVFEAGKNAANDSNKELSASEVINGGLNTVYDVVNSAIDLVEAGVDLTGLDKVIDVVGNTVSKIGGLIPSQAKKVLVVNPVTGQVTVQASNQPQGGIIGSLPQSPYVPIGTTSGGTTYGVDAENALLNVVLGKIRTQGGLDIKDTNSIISAAAEEILGIPSEVTSNVISGVVDATGELIEGITGGESTSSLDNSGTSTIFETVNGVTGNDTVTGGTGNDTVTAGAGNDTITGAGNDTTVSATDGLMGPFQLDEDGNTIADTGQSNTTLTLGPTITAATPCDTAGEVRDPVTLVCGKPTGGGGTDKIICPDTYNNAKAEVDSLDECGGLKSTGGKTKVCPEGTKLAGQTVDINTDCGTITGGQTKVCPEGTKLANQTVDINTDCGTITGGQTKLCPEGTKLAGQTVDINTDCGIITGGGTKLCPEGTKLAGQTVDINTDCGIITGGGTKLCPEGTKLAGQTVDINTDCGIIGDDLCPAGQTYNSVTKQCEYTKVICGPGFTLNIFTNKCEKDPVVEEEEEDVFTLTPPSLGLAGRGDFVTRDDVLVENPGDLGGIYSILPAPVRESFLADRRQQDIRNVADVVGIRPGAGLDQDPGAVERFSRYANAFDIGFPEISNISGILPSEAPLYEETFGVEFRDPGTAPPVRPTEDISKERYTPDLSVFARGGVVENENGIESLLNNRQRAVNRMLIKRAGSYFE